LYDGYDINVHIGTPPQRTRLAVANSRSMVSVASGDSEECECPLCDLPGYNFRPSASSSFSIEGAEDDGVTAFKASDTVTVAGVTVPTTQIGE
jgi:hypothetical protein